MSSIVDLTTLLLRVHVLLFQTTSLFDVCFTRLEGLQSRPWANQTHQVTSFTYSNLKNRGR